MAIHSGSSLGKDAPYEIVSCEDLKPASGVENAWYSPIRKILIVELDVRRYETIVDVEPDDIARLARASREMDARYLEWSLTTKRPRRRKRRPG